MSELRLNILNGNWTVIAPERGDKPRSFNRTGSKDIRQLPEYALDCPFCAGNENRFSIEAFSEMKAPDGLWQVRLVENKYKIFDDHATCPITPERFGCHGVHSFFQGCGNHYLVLENPAHNKVMGEMSSKQVSRVFQCYLDGICLLSKNSNNLISIIFKNQGPMAGGSQAHAHSQIVGSRVVPAWMRNALHTQQRYFDDHGICAMCAMVEFELGFKERVVLESEHAVVLSPYAASTPYELWVIPKRHFPCFQDVSSAELKDLASCVQAVLGCYVSELGNPDFNYVFHSAPNAMSKIPFYHMFVQILPRISIHGGFEIGTGISVNPLSPEGVKGIFNLERNTPGVKEAD